MANRKKHPYLFGGFNDQNQLLPNVWRGVYIRMTNYPVY